MILILKTLQYINWRWQMDPQLTPEEKHEIWMNNCGYLYDRLIVHELKWPSLTFQWLPTQSENEGSTTLQCLYATHSSGQKKQEHIYIAQVEIPRLRSMEDEEAFMTPSSVKRVEKFSHQSEINKARCWESDPNLIAGRVDCGPICIFRRGVQYPETLLTDYNLASGFALEWTAYGLLTADYDGKIVFWANIEEKPQAFQYEDKVGDARIINRSTFCSVADDGKLSIWDFRTGKSETQVKASEKELNCCAVNPDNRSLILTGGDDTHIRIWDIRNPKQKLHYFDDHEGSILSLQWSPHTPSIFASGSQDKKVKIWDMLRVGFQIPKENNGTGELLFTHEGHRGEVTDLDWNPYGMLLGSTEQVGNSFQIYEISNFIQQIEYAEDLNYLKQHCLA